MDEVQNEKIEKPQKAKPTVVVNEGGAEATPRKEDIQKWLDKGWKVKK